MLHLYLPVSVIGFMFIAGYVKKVFYGWWVVLACFFLAFYVGGAVVYGFTAFFEPIVKEFGWSYTQVSIAASLRGLEMGIFAPVIGFMVDRFGARKLAISGTVLIGLGLILLSLTRSLTMFYGSFIVVALGASACTSTVLMTAVANWFRKNVGKALGIMACGFGASGLLVPLIVHLIDIYRWQTALVILGLGMWVVGIPLALIIRRGPEQYGYLPDGELTARPALGAEVQGQDVDVELKEILKARGYWHLAIVEAIRMMVIIAVITHIMPYLTSEGLSRSDAALAATSVPLLSIVGRMGFGWLGDRFDKRYVMVGAFCLMGLGLLAFSYIRTGWLIFPFLILFSPGYGGGTTLRGAILREYFGRSSFGRILGIMVGIAVIGTVSGPALAGWTFDSLGSYHLIWLAFAGLTLIPVILLMKIRPLPQSSYTDPRNAEEREHIDNR